MAALHEGSCLVRPKGTAVHKRRYCASQLLGRLTGPARLLAMSWSKMFVDNKSGTRLLLQKLAASPLVRRNLPNAAATCSQYFAFRRNPNETIGNFLVRETLVHEEFVEAILRLWEDRQGLSQEQRDFGLPEDEEEWTDDDWRSWNWWSWEDEERTEAGDPDLLPSPDGAAEGVDGEAPPPGTPGPNGEPTRGATGSSPSHRPDGPDPLPPSPESIKDKAEAQTLDELTLADSFIMNVLRGWRLLQAAGLSPDEMRDILSTTKNSLDFEMISGALQNLWDDQLLSSRNRAKPGYAGLHHELRQRGERGRPLLQECLGR